MEVEEVKYYHYRIAVDPDLDLCGKNISPHGGITMAVRHKVNDNMCFVAFAKCTPKDNFSKKRGRLIAGGRVLKGVIDVMRHKCKDSGLATECHVDKIDMCVHEIFNVPLGYSRYNKVCRKQTKTL